MNQSRRLRLSKLSLGLVVALAAAPAFAQSTSAGVGGLVTDAGGAPVQGAEVVITHVESGTVSRATSDASGRYIARGLRVGGPYTITVTKAGTGTDTEEGIYLDLNKVGSVDAQLFSGDATTLDAVAVIGSREALAIFNPENKGVGTSISGRQLDLTPSTNRSLDDVARLDPRIAITDPGTGRISVAGMNNRYNNITVDGLGQNDPFGLNSNGMPYTGSPISTDTIAAYDIKVSDYDVAQDSIGANINAVTKSGTNEFHGSAYYVFKNADDMVGKHPVTNQDYTKFDRDVTKGFTLGGPILKDKLFFFASYEEQDVTGLAGDATSSANIASGKISQADLDAVIAAARAQGLEPGTYEGGLGVELSLKRYLGKIDWNISDYHRASLTYQQTEETLPSPYDQGGNYVVFSTRWYTKTSTTKNTSLQLFSDWSDNFSTEFKVSQQKFEQLAGNASNNGPTINIGTIGSTTSQNYNSSQGGIRFGEDRNRHENAIDSKKTTASLFGTLYAGDHALKFGFDWLKNEALNLYGRDLHGVYSYDSVADFIAGNYYRYDVRRPATYDAATNTFTVTDDELSTAATVGMSQLSPFIQDTWQVNDNLSLTYGVRVNIPKSDGRPPVKPGFEETFGFRNDYELGTDNKVVMPRVAFNYTFDTPRYSQLRGGIGLFQSVPPYVWLANPFQNNGVNAVAFCAYRTTATVSGCVNDRITQIYDPSADPHNQPIPATSVAGSTYRAQVDAIDPDFKMPTMWKASLGYDAELPWWGLIGTAEIQHFRAKDAAFYKALNIGTPNGTLLDGRDSYWVTMGGTAKNNGLIPGYSNQSTLLTNTDQGKSTAITFALNKPMSNGWYGNVSVTWTDATEVGSDTSSQAWSSYQFVSRLNPNEEIARTATQQIRTQLKASLGWEHAFFGDYKTSISAYYNGHTGLPYTWLINGDLNGDGIFQDPAYIPLVNDPRVSYGSATAAQIAAFHAFIDSDPYLSARRGKIAERNSARTPWVNQLDLGIQQELPGFFKKHRTVLRLDVYNFLNMLNKDWGITEQVPGGFDSRYLASMGNSVRADGGYVYNLGTPTATELLPNTQRLSVYESNSVFQNRVVSMWSVLMTLRYEF
ncbi:TonB-dependent receptor [Pseudoxanthomonas japonensis]|uniref:TonB-dependent receptor n=1 Tax=Pseudoxanthomonas japonensis TaxID=69284 RepID=UPI001BD048CB|nr:TonB-dependent receptor [Pseudoxanthomonas japonensis]